MARGRKTAWGEELRRLREDRRLSVDALAALVTPSCEGSTISKFENGKMRITEDWVRRLADALGVQVLDITAPAARLAPREEALVEAWRQLGESERDVVYRVADALPKPLPHDPGNPAAAPPARGPARRGRR